MTTLYNMVGFVSLEKNVVPSLMLTKTPFSEKKPIFVHEGFFFYQMSGILSVPALASDPVIYGVKATEEQWVLSQNVKSLIDYVDEYLPKKEENGHSN